MLYINLFSEIQTGSDITWLLWVALGFFGGMVIVGWLTSRNKKPGADYEAGQPVNHKQEENHH